MTPVRRWCIVALGLALVVGTPLTLRAMPAQDQDVSATTLLERVDASSGHPYSGYAESLGTLELPVADRFTDVGALFGERTRMRVWWRNDDSWRVDKLLVTGETDLVHEDGATTEWSYERNRAVTSVDPPIRLPRTADLTPPMVAQRLLRDVDADDLARLPGERVAGREALGLRLAPAAPQSSIDHVDVWADSDTSVPLKVEVYGDGDTEAAFRTEFRDFSDETPAASTIAFDLPADADLGFDSVLDIADAANQYAPVVPPATLAGLQRSADTRGAVGVYGQGVTRLLAIPMRGQEAGPLRRQLQSTFGMWEVDQGTLLSVGPLGVLVTGECEDDGWLVTGTVTDATLVTAADELARVPRPEPDLP
jgi:hypothetical protein